MIAAEQRASQQNFTGLVRTADTLLQAIDKKRKKKDTQDAAIAPQLPRVRRFDRIDAPEWMGRPFARTDEGFLKGRAVVKNVGVFLYQDGKGGIRRELRLPEEIFAPASVDSLKLKPITINHPSEEVTSENVRKYQVGSTGGNPSADGWNPADDGRDGGLPRTDRYHLSIDTVICDDGAIAEVEQIKKDLEAARSQDKLDKAVNARLKVLDAAKRSGVKVEDGMDKAAIKKAIVLKVFPGARGGDVCQLQWREPGEVPR